MFSPNDLKSRLTALRHRRSVVSAVRDPALIEWTYILVVILVAVASIVGMSVYRFTYWNDIDARLAERADATAYDETKLRMIIEEFDDKQRQSAKILVTVAKEEAVMATTSTTTVAESAETSEE